MTNQENPMVKLVSKIAELAAKRHMDGVDTMVNDATFRGLVCEAYEAIPYEKITGPGQVQEGDFLVLYRRWGSAYGSKVDIVSQEPRGEVVLLADQGSFVSEDLGKGKCSWVKAAYILDLSGIGGDG